VATIGRPENLNNPFAAIEMRKAQTEGVRKTGDELNKLAGIKPEQRFVDRKAHESMGPDGFMKLLAHQLKHQDPMKPMDQKDFSANLAQFSQLEQMTAMNKKMDAFSDGNSANKKFQAASFLGKRVVTNGTTLDYQADGKDIEVPFFLEKPAKFIAINIYDNKNQMIGRIERENIGKGMQNISWDGIGLDGELAPKEVYHFDVVAFDQNNEKFMGSTKSDGVVTGVGFENGETVLTLNNGKKVFLRDVDNFSLDSQDQFQQKLKQANNSNNVPGLQKVARNAYNQTINQE